MSKQTPTSFEATASVLQRLFEPAQATAREPAGNAAIIFSAIIVTRGIDRVVKAVEKNTRAVMLASKMDPDDDRLSGGRS